MAADIYSGFVNPGYALSNELQNILARKRAERHQALVDQIAERDAAIRERDVASREAETAAQIKNYEAEAAWRRSQAQADAAKAQREAAAKAAEQEGWDKLRNDPAFKAADPMTRFMTARSMGLDAKPEYFKDSDDDLVSPVLFDEVRGTLTRIEGPKVPRASSVMRRGRAPQPPVERTSETPIYDKEGNFLGTSVVQGEKRSFLTPEQSGIPAGGTPKAPTAGARSKEDEGPWGRAQASLLKSYNMNKQTALDPSTPKPKRRAGAQYALGNMDTLIQTADMAPESKAFVQTALKGYRQQLQGEQDTSKHRQLKASELAEFAVKQSEGQIPERDKAAIAEYIQAFRGY